MTQALRGKRVAILATEGFEQVELTGPREALEKAGAQTDILSAQTGTIRGWNHIEPADEFTVDHTFDSIRMDDYDAVLLPGGVLLISAGLVQGKKITSWPSLVDDLKNAGAHWVDQEVVVDGQLISSRKPDDIPAFSQALVEQLAKAD